MKYMLLIFLCANYATIHCQNTGEDWIKNGDSSEHTVQEMTLSPTDTEDIKNVNTNSSTKARKGAVPSPVDISAASGNISLDNDKKSLKVIDESIAINVTLPSQTSKIGDILPETSSVKPNLTELPTTAATKPTLQETPTTTETSETSTEENIDTNDESTENIKQSSEVTSSEKTGVKSTPAPKDGFKFTTKQGTIQPSPVKHGVAGKEKSTKIYLKDKTEHTDIPQNNATIIWISLTISVVFCSIIGLIVYRKFKAGWHRRHYERVDFLIDGMYDDL